MASRYWIGATDTNWFNTGNWSTSSGGGGGASVPGASDNVVFDANYTNDCVVNANIDTNDLTLDATFDGDFSGGVGFSHDINGDLVLAATGGTLSLWSSTYTITGNLTVGPGAVPSGTGSFIVGGNFEANGTAGSHITWTNMDLDVTGTAEANYVDASGSDASAGTEISAYDSTGVASSNTNWRFESPVGWWEFDEGTGVTAYDKGTGDDDMTLTDMAEGDWITGPNGLPGLAFDGVNDHLTAGDPSTYDAFPKISVAAHIKMSVTNTYMGIVAKHKPTTNRSFYLMMSLGKPFFTYSPNGSSLTYWLADAALLADTDYHIAAACDPIAGTCVLYVDGVAVAATKTNTYTGAINGNTSHLVIGATQNSSGADINNFSGELADLRLYGKVLTLAEVEVLAAMTGGTPGGKSLSPLYGPLSGPFGGPI